ncbi:MAG: DUF1579 family protein [Acidobacteriota bacterium]
MKRMMWFATIWLLFAVNFSAVTALSQEKLSDADKAKLAAASYELAKPGPEHKQLEALVGSWDLEIKFWMQPDNPL